MAGAESLNQFIKAEAHRLGFSLVGVSLPQAPAHFDVFARWLRAGRHARMGYLESARSLDRRADPRSILPGARAVVSLGMLYPVPDPAEPRPGRGRVAAYAWGADYHEIIPARLAELVSALEGYLGRTVAGRGYTDTGPLLERDFAQRAGLGWIGKNTCLIHPRMGSYFLLAELLLDVEAAPDAPIERDFCGSCAHCIAACPTGCILPDRTIDAGRCISYLTIENKGAIPPELRPQMGSWVFGCDICQTACPWNVRFARGAADPALAPRESVPDPLLTEDLHLDAEAFNLKFKGSPIQRPRRRGYLRNVAVAMGNLAGPELVPDLARVVFEEPEPLVRGHAAWALGRIGSARARQALSGALKSEPDGSVVQEIQTALAG